MFLPFLPLIVASTSLSLLSGLMERPEPWLKMPIWIVLPAILVFGILVVQLQQKLRTFYRAELSSFSKQVKPSSSKFTYSRIGIFLIWLGAVYGEQLDLRLAVILKNLWLQRQSVLEYCYWFTGLRMLCQLFQFTDGIFLD